MIIAAFRRKQKIGGWLFFFFWQVAAGVAVTLVDTDWSQYTPRAWTDQFQYLLFMAADAPRLLMLGAVAATGAMSIRTQEWRWLIVLRYALILYSILGMVCVATDLAHFPDRVRADVVTLIFPVVYTIYFYLSRRVRWVFGDREIAT